MDLNSRVNARVVAMLTEGRTDGKPASYIAPCLRQTRQILHYCDQWNCSALILDKFVQSMYF